MIIIANSATEMIFTPRWYTVGQVAQLLNYGESKVRMLIINGQLRSIKDGWSRRILPEWVEAYVCGVDTHPSRTQRADWVGREPFRWRSKIIISRGHAERLLVAQRMSTRPSGDCETLFFPDDSDVRATGL
jgi:excisionase family DNA binding protein